MSLSLYSKSTDLFDVVNPTVNLTPASAAFFVSQAASLETEFVEVAFVVESLTHEIASWS
jgi:hypothetical protein